MEPQQPDNQNQTPEQATGQLPSEQAVLPEPSKSSKKGLVLALVLAVLLIGGGLAWFLTRDKDESNANQPQSTSQSQSTTEAEPAQSTKTTTFTSGLEHKTTASFDHPSDWEVTESEVTPEGATGYSLKSMVIASPDGHFLHIFDRDGIGGTCDPNAETYTLYKEIGTTTTGMNFKDFEVSSQEHLSHVLILETEGMASELAEHDALEEGQSAQNTCNISGFSTIGASGVFVVISDGSTLDGSNRLGWDDIKEDTEFVRVLESMTAEDKSDS